MSTFMKPGQNWLYDTVTGDIVGVKDPDGSEQYFARTQTNATTGTTELLGPGGVISLCRGTDDLTSYGDGAIVLSSMLQHSRLSSDLGDRKVAVTATIGAQNGAVQESASWAYGGLFYKLVTGSFASPGLYLYWSTTRGGPWTVVGTTPVINDRYHSFVYVEGDTVYCYAPDSATDLQLHVHTASAAAIAAHAAGGVAATWTDVKSWTVSTTVTNFTLWGNVSVMKDSAGVYQIMMEGSTSANSWQMAHGTMSSPTGTITTDQILLTSLRPSAGNSVATVSGPMLFQEGDTWVLLYHAGPVASLPTQGYLATCSDITADAWTIQNNGQPILTRQHEFEVDQVADLDLLIDPANGSKYLYWTAIDNVAKTSHIMGAPLRPALVEKIGSSWVNVGGESQPNRGITDPQMSGFGIVSTDFTSSNAGAYADITGATVSFIAKSNTCVAKLNSCFTNTVPNSGNLFRVYSGSLVFYAGSVYNLNSGTEQSAYSCTILLTGLIPGQRYIWQAGVMVTTGTFQVRAASYPGNEQFCLEICDAKVPLGLA